MRWLLLVLLLVATSCKRHHAAPRICGHKVALDKEKKLLPWAPYDKVTRLAWNKLLEMPPQEGGLPAIFSHSRFDPKTFVGDGWPHNPAVLVAMLIESALHHHAFTGDKGPLELARKLADHQLARGTTPDGWKWARVPYASAAPGSLDWNGADDSACGGCGRGDGVGVIEPDKVAELGLGYLRLSEATCEARYREAAERCADALAANVRPGDAERSPWPFRVRAQIGEVREEYTGHVIAAIALFDALKKHEAARGLAWRWLMAFPMKTHHWTAYFEDIPIAKKPDENPNQYAPLMTARYLLEHTDLDADWRAHVSALLAWTVKTFASTEHGAEVLSEQKADMAKMGSHTARYASVQALYFERTGDAAAKEKARRAFNWATYPCDETGVVAVGPDKNEGWWFSDGYGDYIRHFYVGMAAVPELAPAESHLLRSSSTVKEIAYGPKEIRYVTADAVARDVLRLNARPVKVVAGGAEASAVLVEELSAGGFVVRVARDKPDVVISLP